jgi:hypothetical protein
MTVQYLVWIFLFGFLGFLFYVEFNSNRRMKRLMRPQTLNEYYESLIRNYLQALHADSDKTKFEREITYMETAVGRWTRDIQRECENSTRKA